MTKTIVHAVAQKRLLREKGGSEPTEAMLLKVCVAAADRNPKDVSC